MCSFRCIRLLLCTIPVPFHSSLSISILSNLPISVFSVLTHSIHHVNPPFQENQYTLIHPFMPSRYITFSSITSIILTLTIHSVNPLSGKPWAVLLFEYLPEGPDAIAPSTLYSLGKQVTAHVLWRKAFFTASGDRPPGDTLFNYQY